MEIIERGRRAALSSARLPAANGMKRWLYGLSLLVLAVAAQAQGNPYAKGPDPTVAALEADSGPFAIASTAVSSPVGFGGGTVYYPTAAGSYAAIAICPGFTATQSSVAWLGRRIASHGFVAITINTNTIFDQPSSRANQLMAALRYLTNSSNATVRSRVDATRLGVAGHSMGGGGSLIASRDNPSLKAAVPLTPWSTTTNFSAVQVPTFILGAENDLIAPVALHAIPFYNSLSASLRKAYGELNNAGHSVPTSSNSTIGKYAVSWVKRFMDNDTRYSPFLCGAPHQAVLAGSTYSNYRSSCPY